MTPFTLTTSTTAGGSPGARTGPDPPADGDCEAACAADGTNQSAAAASRNRTKGRRIAVRMLPGHTWDRSVRPAPADRLRQGRDREDHRGRGMRHGGGRGGEAGPA